MKTCAERRAELIDLVFGELDDRTEIACNEHLLECAVCRAEEQRLLGNEEAKLLVGQDDGCFVKRGIGHAQQRFLEQCLVADKADELLRRCGA